jgi:hypothetical protein
MRLQVDTKAKAITVEDNVNLFELVTWMKQVFPKGLWKKFTVRSNTTFYWNTHPVYTYTNHVGKWDLDNVMCTTEANNTLMNDVFNVDLTSDFSAT